MKANTLTTITTENMVPMGAASPPPDCPILLLLAGETRPHLARWCLEPASRRYGYRIQGRLGLLMSVHPDDRWLDISGLVVQLDESVTGNRVH